MHEDHSDPRKMKSSFVNNPKHSPGQKGAVEWFPMRSRGTRLLRGQLSPYWRTQYFTLFFGWGFPNGLRGDVFDTIVNKSYTGLNSWSVEMCWNPEHAGITALSFTQMRDFHCLTSDEMRGVRITLCHVEIQDAERSVSHLRWEGSIVLGV